MGRESVCYTACVERVCVWGGERADKATELFEGCESDTFRGAVSDQNTVAYE